MKAIVFTVTNDLVYDQRMQRICNSLAQAGYDVTLIGSKHKASAPCTSQLFRQKRIHCLNKKGFAFYAEYNIKLFLHLLFQNKADAYCCIDLDTLLPVFFISKWKKAKLVYDAHEYFSQQKEIITRPRIYSFWHWIEKTWVPRIPNGYTVSQSIAEAFEKEYGVRYKVIMNTPLLRQAAPVNKSETAPVLLYQGAVNHARGLEYLIPAMKQIEAVLHIYGDGNFMDDAHQLIQQNNLEDKVLLMGKADPMELRQITQSAYLGLNLVEPVGLNQWYSLANKFFDYIHANIPQVTMNFPEYKRINDVFLVAVLIDQLSENEIARAVNSLIHDREKYQQLQANCASAATQLNWQNEEKKLIDFYNNLLG